MKKNTHFVVALMIVISVLLSACQPANEPEQIIKTVIVEGTPQTVIVTATPAPLDSEPDSPKVLRMNLTNGDVPTIDPALTSDNASVQIVEETTVGLTRLNEETALSEPAMATSWEISEDGKVITFHLRDDVPWVKYDASSGSVVKVKDCFGDDRMVTAQDFAYGVLRTLNPDTASDYAFVLNILNGAAEYNSGESKDPKSVGVRVIDDSTIEYSFKDSLVFNLNIVSMWVGVAQPKWIIEGDDCTEARGDRWTEMGFFQGYGPYVLKEWVHDSSITLIKNPFWPGAESVPQAKIDEITWTMLDDPAAFAEYEAGNMDVARVPQAEMDRVRVDPVLSTELDIAPDYSSYYYAFNTKLPFVDDVRVRRALSMAVDRQSLVENVTKGGQEPAQWISRPGLAGAPTMESHPDLGIKYDPEQAKNILQEYLDEKHLTADQVDITLMYNTSAGHKRIAEAIQQMWKDTLGINVKLTNQEWKVMLKTLQGSGTPQVFRSGWTMDFPDADNFTRNLFASGGNDNNGKGGGLNWKNEEFEKLVKKAATETDPVERTDLYAQAENILTYEDAVVMPLYWYTRVAVTRPYVQRTYSVLGTLQRIEKWDLLPQ